MLRTGVVLLLVAGVRRRPRPTRRWRMPRRRRIGRRFARCSSKRADVNAPQADGMTALHWAAYHDDLETAKLLLARRRRRQGREPVRRDAAVAGLHQRQRGDGRAAARGRRRPERRAARRRDAADDRGAHRRARVGEGAARRAAPTWTRKDERRGQTALMWAAAEGHADVVEALIEAGADFRARAALRASRRCCSPCAKAASTSSACC